MKPARRLAPPRTCITRKLRGVTLFEVLLALVIFAGSMTAVGQLISNGVRGALQSRLRTEAAMLAEAKLSEVVAGAAPMQSTGATAFPDDPAWTWQLALGPGPITGVMRLDVIVEREATTAQGRMKYTLSRLTRDPAVFAAAEAENAAAEEAAANSSSSESAQ